MAAKLLLPLFLALLVVTVAGRGQSVQLSESQQCRLQRLSATRPSERIESEGGLTELWNEFDEQFQCTGVAPIRNTIRPNSLSLPNFHPAPRLVYIIQGQGLLGVNIPGCGETFGSHQSFEQGQEQHQSTGKDQHQRVHRVRQGDLIVLPAGATHWCFNDGNEDLIAISVTDLKNPHNQLDQKFRAFYLAGTPPQQSKQARESIQNIFQAFDEELMAQAFNVPTETIRTMQRQDEKRGLIVNVKEGMKMMIPDEEESRSSNGIEETICTTNFIMNIDSSRETYVYTKQAGRLNIVNQQKMPILGFVDLTATRGNLEPGALMTPGWALGGHAIVYVTKGDAQVEVVGHNGETLLNERVSEGDIFVTPHYFVTTGIAGSNGFEWVTFKTSTSPFIQALVGKSSVFSAMPTQVITNAYQCSVNEAEQLKMNRAGESILLSPFRGSTY